jgi:hypothetical protein
MKYPMQTAFFACILTAGSMAASGQANAFGQQWRPAASGPLPAQTRPYQRMTNLPSFRPQPDARRVGRAGPELRRSERYLAGGWRQHPPQRPSMPIQSGYQPAPTLASVHPVPAPMPQPLAVYRPQPSMADTFWSWQQMPMMARQFGVPGFVQPWMPQPQQPAAYPYHPAPAGYGHQANAQMPTWGHPAQARVQAPAHWPETADNRRFSVPAASGHVRSWRPAEPALSAVRSPQQPFASQRAATTWRGATTAFAAATPRSNRALGVFNAQPPQWRTGAMAWSRPQSPSNRFRPPTYGRSVPSERLDAPKVASVSASQTAGLPGWATTYTDDPWNSCGWCSGS